jgi:glycerol-3-phosphate acyltransferase PlsX
VKLALDAAAGDLGLEPNIEGAIQAAVAYGVELILVGPAARITQQLSARGIGEKDPRFEVVDAPDLIAMDEEPAAACRAKPRASIMVCAELVASGKAQGLVSVGHSGATMVAALWHLKRLRGVQRPAIAVPLPTTTGFTVLLDAGANTECKPWHLVQFAAMGRLYSKHVLGVAEPTVGILSNGEEECKGNDLVRETVPLLKQAKVNFTGPVEGRDLVAGLADVVVCDGFTGNVVVKLIEGTASSILATLKAEVSKRPLAKLGALLMRGAFGALKKRLSYDEYGGAPLLGVGGTAIIAHGKSNAKAVANALRVAKQMAASGLAERIVKDLAAQTQLEGIPQ